MMNVIEKLLKTKLKLNKHEIRGENFLKLNYWLTLNT